MLTVSYRSAINFAAGIAPFLEKPTEFIKWAEDIAELLSFIYSKDYDKVTEDLVDKCKEEQNYESEED